MYSEEADFKEKDTVYSEMVKFISSLACRDWLELAKGCLALEFGGSGGLLGGIVSNVADRVICTDVIDTQLQYGGQFGKLLKEKFERNGRDLNLGKIEFHVADAQDLNYRDNLFDLVYSQNALEHVPDPLSAIRESIRVLKPGGIFYATFDPVWTADSGSHFIDYVREPWLHILLGDDEFCELMRKGSAEEWQLASYRSDLNRLPCSFYKDQIPKLLDSLTRKFDFKKWTGCVDPSFIKHANLSKAARKLSCDSNDLLVRGFRFFAIK